MGKAVKYILGTNMYNISQIFVGIIKYLNISIISQMLSTFQGINLDGGILAEYCEN